MLAVFRKAVVAAIRAYRYVISPLLPAACRFTPTCSAYAEEAVCTHGFLRGSGMALRRILRCHPWHPGGYDPVRPASETHIR